MRPLLSSILGVVCSAFLTASAGAQTYPNHAVRVIAPFPPGSNADQVGRILSGPLQQALGQPFIIENRAGASGSIAADFVAKSAPDGYTLFLTTNSPLVVNQSLFKLSYDPVKDFSPIARVGVTGFVIMVRPDSPAKTLADLIAMAKAQPGKLTGASGGAGGQVSVELLKAMAHLDLTHVPYKGVPQSVTDLLGGNIDFDAVDLGNAIPMMQSGKLRPLAITLSEPTSLAPGVPTVASTFPGFEVVAWQRSWRQATGVPADVVAKLYDATKKALTLPQVQAAFANTGNVVAPLDPTEFAAYIKAEIPKWAKLVAQAKLKAE